MVLTETAPHDDKLSHHAVLSLLTDNSPSEESSATAEKEEDTEESDHEGKPFALKTGVNHCISLIFDLHIYRNCFSSGEFA